MLYFEVGEITCILRGPVHTYPFLFERGDFFLHFQMKKPHPQVAGVLTVFAHPRENAIVTESRTIFGHVNGSMRIY